MHIIIIIIVIDLFSTNATEKQDLSVTIRFTDV